MTGSSLPPRRHRFPHPGHGRGKGVTIAVFATFATFALPIAASAKATRNKAGEETIAQCIRRASGGRAWLEKTLWGLRDQEGGWIGAEVANTDGSHDLGPLQINSWWAPRIAARLGRSEAEVRQWLRHDACFNAGAARWIFLSGLRATGDYWKAIGVYHSPTKWRQQRYATGVAGHLKHRFGAGLFESASSNMAARRPAQPEPLEPSLRQDGASTLARSDEVPPIKRSSSTFGFGAVRTTSEIIER